MFSLFYGDQKPEQGEVVLQTTKSYPPDVVNAWVEALEQRLIMQGEHLAWRYVRGRFVELRTDGDPYDVLEEIELGKLDIESFAENYR